MRRDLKGGLSSPLSRNPSHKVVGQDASPVITQTNPNITSSCSSVKGEPLCYQLHGTSRQPKQLIQDAHLRPIWPQPPKERRMSKGLDDSTKSGTDPFIPSTYTNDISRYPDIFPQTCISAADGINPHPRKYSGYLMAPEKIGLPGFNHTFVNSRRGCLDAKERASTDVRFTTTPIQPKGTKGDPPGATARFPSKVSGYNSPPPIGTKEHQFILYTPEKYQMSSTLPAETTSWKVTEPSTYNNPTTTMPSPRQTLLNDEPGPGENYDIAVNQISVFRDPDSDGPDGTFFAGLELPVPDGRFELSEAEQESFCDSNFSNFTDFSDIATESDQSELSQSPGRVSMINVLILKFIENRQRSFVKAGNDPNTSEATIPFATASSRDTSSSNQQGSNQSLKRKKHHGSGSNDCGDGDGDG